MDEQDRVLLVRQGDFDTWGTVGWAIDVGEHPEEAARREAGEEVGTEVELTGLEGPSAGRSST